MYTKLDDMKMAQTILFYLSKNPNATRTQLIRDCYTTMRRITKLQEEGYINIPPQMPREIRNREYRENKAIQQTSP